MRVKNSSPKKECTRLSWTLVKQTGKKISFSRLKCKCWNCEVCGPMRQKQLQFKGREGKPNKFLTLTVRAGNDDDQAAQARSLVQAWRTIRRRARKEFHTGRIEFLAVFENTQFGAPHLHILCRMQFVPQAWISRQMRALLDSPICDIRRVRSRKQAAWYVSKYVSKAPTRWKGCKRYWRSMSWCDPKKRQELVQGKMPDLYYMARAIPKKVAQLLLSRGFTERSRGETGEYLWKLPNPPPIRPGHFYEVVWDQTQGSYALFRIALP